MTIIRCPRCRRIEPVGRALKRLRWRAGHGWVYCAGCREGIPFPAELVPAELQVCECCGKRSLAREAPHA